MAHDAESTRRSVVFVCNEFPPIPGGTGMYGYYLARELAGAGVAVHVFCPRYDELTVEQRAFDAAAPFGVTRYGGGVHGWLGTYRRVRMVRRFCREHDVACLIGSGRRALWIAHRAAAAAGRPWLAIGYGSEFLDSRARRRERTTRAVCAADGAIAISRFTGRKMIEAGVAPERLHYILPGAELPAPLPSDDDLARLRRRLALEGSKIILTVGRVSRRKAQDVVIRAMPAILERVPEAMYLVVGVPAEREEFARLAAELDVAERVRFTGPVAPEELSAYYALCDVFVLNSRLTTAGDYEGFGMVLVEAGLAGKPVVGTRDCGAEEAIDEGITGLLVNQDAPAETAAAIIRLLTDDAFARELGESGRRRAREQFSWRRAGRQLLDLIRPWLGT